MRVKEYDYRDMIKRVEDAVNAQVNSFLRSIGNDNVKVSVGAILVPWRISRAFFQAVVNAGTAIAQCVKTCFLEKNKDGFCFTRIGYVILITNPYHVIKTITLSVASPKSKTRTLESPFDSAHDQFSGRRRWRRFVVAPVPPGLSE